MANYNPPTEDITSFNTLLFNQPEVILSQAEADLLYLSKVSTTISTAGLTTFNNGVSVGGNITGSSLIQSNTTSASTNSIYNNLFSGSTLTIGTSGSPNSINGFSTFNQGLLGNLNTNTIDGNGNTGTKSLFTSLTGTLNIGQATTTLVNVKGLTTFDLGVNVGGALNLNAVAVSVGAPNATSISLFSGYNNNVSIFPSFDTGTINIGNGAFPGGALNLNNVVRLRSRINLHRKQIISATSTISAFSVSPIAETIQITATGNITITLPLCQYSDFEDGLIFKFVKTASITNSITIAVNTTGATNFIYAKGSVIPATPTATSQTLLVNADTTTSLVVLFNTPYFIWVEI